MTDELALFARTFVIGVAVAAPVGAMGVLCAQRTLERGVGAGLATGLGIATADALFAGVAAFGVSALSEALVAWQTPLRIVGGIALVYLGLTCRPSVASNGGRALREGCSRLGLVSRKGSTSPSRGTARRHRRPPDPLCGLPPLSA